VLVCVCVSPQYINTNVHVPWEDMRYVFGQIMYGGHITDAWDRRCNNTYLDVFMQPDILSGFELAPGFKVPDMSAMSYSDIASYFTTSLPNESPPMFGLHPNAEIGYLTAFAEDLFQTILILGGTGGGGGGGDLDKGVRSTLEDLLERCPEDFVMIDIKVRCPSRSLVSPSLHLCLAHTHAHRTLSSPSLHLSISTLSTVCRVP
jgi:dynein heavy chain